MSGKLIHNLKRKREEECSSNSSKNSSPAGSPLTTISQTSVIVNPSYSSSSSSTSTPSSYLLNGNSTNSLSIQHINYCSSDYNKPGTSTIISSSLSAPSSSSSSASSSSSCTAAASISTISSSCVPTHEVDKIISQEAKREKHDFYVDTPESSNDGTEGLLPPTPPSESDDLSQQQQQQQQQQPEQEHEQELQILPTSRNTFLVEALKRIVELQHELEELDQQQSEEDDHEVSNIIGQRTHNNHNEFQQEQDNFGAEALGFAMCARETLLFLQSEGVPENSDVYKALREKLVGKSPQGIPI